jgi:hypothetical protein
VTGVQTCALPISKKVKKTVRFLDKILARERTEVRNKTVSTTGI